MLPLVRFLLGFMLVFTALFLILLVLIQRGRGGGLAGAFGGAGGQSAFGTKAGDMFTKITIGVAAFWIILCILAINVLGRQQSLFSGSLGSSAPQAVQPGPGNVPPQGASDGDDAAAAVPARDAGEKASGEAPVEKPVTEPKPEKPATNENVKEPAAEPKKDSP